MPGQGLRPNQQVRGERDDLEPDLVLGEAVEGQVPQPGVLQATDAVLSAGALPVSDLQGSQCPAGATGVGGEAGDPPPVLIGQPQLRTGWGRSRRARTRIPVGHPTRVSGR